jgi:hypothetical protein
VFLIFIAHTAFNVEFHRAAYEAGAATAIVNIGVTRADDFVPLKINARVGEVKFLEINLAASSTTCVGLSTLACFELLQILPRVLDLGSLSIPALL